MDGRMGPKLNPIARAALPVPLSQKNASFWGMTSPHAGALIEGDIYRSTAVGEYFLKRRTILERDRFITYHNYERDKEDKKSWYLDRKCELSSVSDTPSVHRLRPPGTWTLTAKAAGLGKPVSLVSWVGGVREPGRCAHWRCPNFTADPAVKPSQCP